MDKDGVMVTYAYVKNGAKYYWINSAGVYTKTYAEKDTVGYTIYDQATGTKMNYRRGIGVSRFPFLHSW